MFCVLKFDKNSAQDVFQRLGRLPTDAAPKEKSYADALLGEQQPVLSPPLSTKRLFLPIKSAEYPSFPLPNFKTLFLSRPLFPQDEPSSPHNHSVHFLVHSDGDDVTRTPTTRHKISASLRSFTQEINAKFKKGRRGPYSIPVIRQKWKNLAPISAVPTSEDTSKRASDFYGNPKKNIVVEESRDDSMVEYESVWRSSSSDDEADEEYEKQLALENALIPVDYNDFSLAPLQHTRRKYNKRFRNLPPPLTTRSSRNNF